VIAATAYAFELIAHAGHDHALATITADLTAGRTDAMFAAIAATYVASRDREAWADLAEALHRADGAS
jgi:hypothetical protein